MINGRASLVNLHITHKKNRTLNKMKINTAIKTKKLIKIMITWFQETVKIVK